MSRSQFHSPLVRRVAVLLGRRNLGLVPAHDERATRDRLYGGRRTIDVAPRKPPVNESAPPVGEPDAARDHELAFADGKFTG